MPILIGCLGFLPMDAPTKRARLADRARKALAVLRDGLVDLFNGGVSKRFAFFAIALGLALLAGVWFVFDLLPDLAVDAEGLEANDRLQRENDVRTTGLQALAGIVLAIGGAFTAYSVLSTREGQLDERFARSLELMASSEGHVVSGAIFSLERIAVQSRFDRTAVVDVLAGFVRARMPLGRQADERVPPEVMDALHVLARVKELRASPQPDLRRTSWKGTSLLVDLSEVLLTGSFFEGALLHGGQFRKANLILANFKKAFAMEADFTGADLSSADLSGALLHSADFSDANLFGANLSGTDLTYTRFSDGTNLQLATYDEGTKFPEGFSPEEHDMRAAEADEN